MTTREVKGGKTVDIVFVLFDIGLTLENSAVFQSQVGDQVISLQSMGFRVGILALYKEEEKFNTVIGNKLRKTGISLTMIKEKGFGKDLVSMAQALRKWKQQNQIRFCYVRGLWGPLLIKLAAPFSGIPYIYDVRGDLEDELSSVNSKSSRKKIYLALERWGIRNANKVTAVTSVLADIVAQKFSLANVYVIPCCINTADFFVPAGLRIEKRKQLGFAESDIIMVYSGGLSHYQQVPKMLELWKKFIDHPDIKFLLLTNDDPHSHPVTIGGINLFGDKLIHKSLPRNEIAVTLAAADIAFMLRDARALNRAASPVKFPEYLSAGLAIVASPHIGDMSNYILQQEIGVLVDVDDLTAGEIAVSNLAGRLKTGEGQKIREAATKLSGTIYEWSYYREVFGKLYEKNV